jgi:hypothetical protein
MLVLCLWVSFPLLFGQVLDILIEVLLLEIELLGFLLWQVGEVDCQSDHIKGDLLEVLV